MEAIGDISIVNQATSLSCVQPSLHTLFLGSKVATIYNRKTTKHLMHLIATRNGNVPNFSLLLGSGASITSGVQTAQDMIQSWRKLLFEHAGTSNNFQNWLSCQSWFDHDDEYSILFEEIYDQPALRRVFIEECIKKAHPNWGYVYLAELLANHFFDIVLTTNFDDLMNEACYLYSDGLRPIVAAHDSAIQGIQISSERPKIIKLHGDFLYDNIKNTLVELETLEVNIKQKINYFAKEYGLVVLGYSGRDRSVMDTLELLLRDSNNFRQGVYWCIHHGATISNRLDDFLRKDRVYLVEIDGFDEFTADLHKEARLEPPRAIVRPYDVARDRLKLFAKIGDFNHHSVIGSHIRMLLSESARHIDNVSFPPQFKASLLTTQGKFEDAIHIWAQLYEKDPTDLSAITGYANALADGNKNDELANLVRKSDLSISDKTYFLLRASQDLEVVDLSTKFLNQVTSHDEIEQMDQSIVRINRAIALKRLGQADEMRHDLKILEQSVGEEDVRRRVGIAALKGGQKEFLDELASHLEAFSPRELEVFPVFEDYGDDPEFRKLVSALTESRQEVIATSDVVV